jgi:2-polyprenyl-3-methyl-5-hydroxy-6-metoxy-1,4-benzoquinol methylase
MFPNNQSIVTSKQMISLSLPSTACENGIRQRMIDTALARRATDESQYDSGNIDWEVRGGPYAPRTLFYWEYIKPYTTTWAGKAILDVGAGLGWLSHNAMQLGASEVVAIDPSERNIGLAKKYFPEVHTLRVSFENYKPHGRCFDLILVIMSFPHIADIDLAFGKLVSILNRDGEIIVVIPDHDHYVSAEEGECIQTEDICAGQFAVSITRSTGTIVDVVRRVTVYQLAAERVGLTLMEDKPMFSAIDGSVMDYPSRRLLRFRQCHPPGVALLPAEVSR